MATVKPRAAPLGGSPAVLRATQPRHPQRGRGSGCERLKSIEGAGCSFERLPSPRSRARWGLPCAWSVRGAAGDVRLQRQPRGGRRARGGGPGLPPCAAMMVSDERSQVDGTFRRGGPAPSCRRCRSCGRLRDRHAARAGRQRHHQAWRYWWAMALALRQIATRRCSAGPVDATATTGWSRLRAPANGLAARGRLTHASPTSAGCGATRAVRVARLVALPSGEGRRRNSSNQPCSPWRASRGARRGPTCVTAFAAR
jgi:hypothetical protein